jgi:enoyl-CoA hydratase
VPAVGRRTTLSASFTLHQLNHSHCAEIHESKHPVAEPQDGIPDWRTAPPVLPALKDRPEAPAPTT